MKIQKIANHCLKEMCKCHAKSNRYVFDMDFFLPLFPSLSKREITEALYLLEEESFVSIFSADNVAYATTLTSDGIRHIQEDTFAKKILLLIRECIALIKDLPIIPG